jgi:hypothetical protein
MSDKAAHKKELSLHKEIVIGTLLLPGLWFIVIYLVVGQMLGHNVRTKHGQHLPFAPPTPTKGHIATCSTAP